MMMITTMLDVPPPQKPLAIDCYPLNVSSKGGA